MKMCPYCGEDVGINIEETEHELLDEGLYRVFKAIHRDYIVTCPNCNGKFGWCEIYSRTATYITDCDTGKWRCYKGSE